MLWTSLRSQRSLAYINWRTRLWVYTTMLSLPPTSHTITHSHILFSSPSCSGIFRARVQHKVPACSRDLIGFQWNLQKCRNIKLHYNSCHHALVCLKNNNLIVLKCKWIALLSSSTVNKRQTPWKQLNTSTHNTQTDGQTDTCHYLKWWDKTINQLYSDKVQQNSFIVTICC